MLPRMAFQYRQGSQSASEEAQTAWILEWVNRGQDRAAYLAEDMILTILCQERCVRAVEILAEPGKQPSRITGAVTLDASWSGFSPKGDSFKGFGKTNMAVEAASAAEPRPW